MKKRELLNNYGDKEVTLVDITNKLVEVAPEIAKLEINDNKAAANKAIRQLVDAKKLMEKYLRRLREIKSDITAKPILNKNVN